MTPRTPNVDELAHKLERVRYRHTADEARLQEEIARVLAQLGVVHEREVRLSATERIDFLVLADHIGIEVKVKGSANAVTRQLLRYAEHASIDGLVLLTTRSQIVVPRALLGKPVARCVVRNL